MTKRQSIMLLSMTIACFAGTTQVMAQRRYYEAGATSQVDAYGNASPVWLERRSVALYQNDAQRQAFRNYQDDSRRTNNRGGVISFAIGADAVQLSRARRNLLLNSGSIGTGGLQNTVVGSSLGLASRVPVSRSDRSRMLTQIYSRYGGFRRRIRSGQTSDISTLFARKYELLQATTLTAPVRRANMLRGGSFGTAAAISTIGSGSTSSEIDKAVDVSLFKAGLGLDEALMASLDDRYDETIERGWHLFKIRNYQQASRAFESASTIDSKAIEPRVAEIFCHVATGAMRTATVSLGSLTRRFDQPFDMTLDVRGKFANDVEARRIVLQTQMAMRANSNSSLYAPTALHSLILWYSGDRSEAARVAKLLVRDEVPTELRSWPTWMSAQLSAQPSPIQ